MLKLEFYFQDGLAHMAVSRPQSSLAVDWKSHFLTS